MKKTPWLAEMAAYLLALLFLYTALSKLFDFRHFIRAINNQPFDNRYTPVLVVAIPLAEILTGILLLVPKSRLAGFSLSSILMLVFTMYVGLVTFHFYDRVPCGCAGVFQRMSWPEHLVFNVLFLLLSVLGLRIALFQNKTTLPLV